MKLAEIAGKYDAIFSLGDLCQTSIQLERNGLRPFSGVLDWMGSFNLPDVSRLLRCRFANFMDKSHLKCLYKASDKLFMVYETEYNIYSNHDFFVHQNSPEQLEAYPAVKAKYDRRIERFLRAVERCQRILFIRCGGTFEEVQELCEVLSGLVANEFRLLLVQSTSVSGLVENEWPLERVCAVQVPTFTNQFDEAYNPYWERLLEGVEYDDSILI